jgi:hypothetical protein
VDDENPCHGSVRHQQFIPLLRQALIGFGHGEVLRPCSGIAQRSCAKRPEVMKILSDAAEGSLLQSYSLSAGVHRIRTRKETFLLQYMKGSGSAELDQQQKPKRVTRLGSEFVASTQASDDRGPGVGGWATARSACFTSYRNCNVLNFGHSAVRSRTGLRGFAARR